MTIKKTDGERKEPPFVVFSEAEFEKYLVVLSHQILTKVVEYVASDIDVREKEDENGDIIKEVIIGKSDDEDKQEEFSNLIEGIITGIRFTCEEYRGLYEAGEIEPIVYGKERRDAMKRLSDVLGQRMADMSMLMMKMGVKTHEDENGSVIPDFNIHMATKSEINKRESENKDE